MTRNLAGDSTIVGPVMQFSLLIVPMVMNGFFSVYSLTGWVLSGKEKLNWSLEAETVGFWVALGMLIFSSLVAAYTVWRGGNRWHPLVVSSAGHAVLAVLLTLSIFITVRL
jgi:divalent metal cation (Fe/Co/Zn/Cd) transporter